MLSLRKSVTTGLPCSDPSLCCLLPAFVAFYGRFPGVSVITTGRALLCRQLAAHGLYWLAWLHRRLLRGVPHCFFVRRRFPGLLHCVLHVCPLVSYWKVVVAFSMYWSTFHASALTIGTKA